MKRQREGYSDIEYARRNREKRNGRTGTRRQPDKRKGRTGRRKRKAPIFRYFVILIILVLLFVFLLSAGQFFQKTADPVSSSADDSGAELANLHSPNAVLVRLNPGGTGETAAQKNAGERIYPASLTKIMTAILAIENIDDAGQWLEVPAGIFPFLYEMDASVAGFEPGETVTAEALLYGVILESGAECCLTLADYTAGSEDAFVELMNRKAEKLGMDDTHFCNTTGLQDTNHYTTVEDLAVLLEYALKNQTFRQIFTSSSYTVESTDLHPEGFTMQSTLFENLGNPLVKGGEILGGKTGYTEEAGLCLASLAEVDGAEYILVTAHAEGSHETEPYHIEDAVNVFEQIS